MTPILKKNKDITNIVFEKCFKNDIIHIPGECEERDLLFGDPCVGINKYIIFETSEGGRDEDIKIHIFYRDIEVYFDLSNIKFYTNTMPVEIIDRFENKNNHTIEKPDGHCCVLAKRNNLANELLSPCINDSKIDTSFKMKIYRLLQKFHEKTKLDFGMFYDNLTMQILMMKYLNGLEKVLEIGGNIGRCSLLIANILNAKSNTDFVSLDSNPEYAKRLIHNRDQNGLSFHIENSALSKSNLIQLEDKTTISDVLVDGFFQVNTISWSELNEIYNIDFDTLIIDCNDAFYDILLDFPEMLKNMKLIIMKNEYYDVFKKIKIENILEENKFYLEYSETGGNCPCYYSYYEVWKVTQDE
jgi:FkbM family methyltransferase